VAAAADASVTAASEVARKLDGHRRSGDERQQPGSRLEHEQELHDVDQEIGQ